MYTFSPIPDVPVEHVGFVMIVLVTIFFSIVYILNECEKLVAFDISAEVGSLVCLIAYCVSFVWTDQTPKTYANVPVVGEFVEFVAEGYNIPVQSGKTTRHVDQHEQYVVYKVNGQRVMMRASLGQTYPERVTLYKN